MTDNFDPVTTEESFSWDVRSWHSGYRHSLVIFIASQLNAQDMLQMFQRKICFNCSSARYASNVPAQDMP
ncbi:hypothetical protein OUZ56_029424 [Daphnia magna]|uniref:Uncharacterized protein n=1 Tax=Daphnia magna TaxID=35525 RepID=A0ABR0B6S1_9CRUS|nr:hypothetical protein OUZ56_029424 [Daphnia magna]